MKWIALRLSVALVGSSILISADSAQLYTAVAAGWHPWYEVHVDPEDSKNILVCGAKWDFGRNALWGFVYRSADGGSSWRQVLEDKNSDWVSEQSCAFGPHHTAYFLSEASLVRDGQPNHHLGTSRLFVSTNGGETWNDTLKMGWADWSTSAVNSRTGELVTFYHYSGDSDGPENYGSTIGVITFGPDGKRARGPFLNEEMRARNYQGVYPFSALNLNDGTAAALYYGRRLTPAGSEFDLGVIRSSKAGPLPSSITQIAASETKNACFSALGDSDLAYDSKTDTLAVTFLSLVDKNCDVILAESTDHGDSWKKSVLMSSELVGEGFLRPSIAYGSRSELGVLWLNRRGIWQFVVSQNGHLFGKPAALWKEPSPSLPSQDSLWTVIANSPSLNKDQGESDIDVTLRSLSGRIWRAKGLATVGEQFYAVGLAVGEQGQKLYTAAVGGFSGGEYTFRNMVESFDENDVTPQIRILFGGAQYFDPATGTLAIDLRLINRGETPIWTPIHVIVDKIESSNGNVAIINSDNGKSGAGAIWDLSRSVTGDQIPAKAPMFNTFELRFRLSVSNWPLRTNRLLTIKARVQARIKPSETASAKGR